MQHKVKKFYMFTVLEHRRTCLYKNIYLNPALVFHVCLSRKMEVQEHSHIAISSGRLSKWNEACISNMVGIERYQRYNWSGRTREPLWSVDKEVRVLGPQCPACHLWPVALCTYWTSIMNCYSCVFLYLSGFNMSFIWSGVLKKWFWLEKNEKNFSLTNLRLCILHERFKWKGPYVGQAFDEDNVWKS